MSDEQITPEDLGILLATTIASLARKAGEEDAAQRARDYAEAAERLANALAYVTAGEGNKSRERSGRAQFV
jgi:hypothetical protein